MRSGRRSLAWKIAAANILLALFAVLLAVALQYRKERRVLEGTMRDDLTQAVTSGALLLDGAKTEALANGSDTPQSAALERDLHALKEVSPTVARLYVLGPGTNDTPRLLLSWGVPAELTPASMVSTSFKACMAGGGLITTGLYEDSDGQWLSAFQPLRDRKGRAVAVLGADLRASDLKLQARERLRSTLYSAFAAASLAILLSILLARSVTKPLKVVAESTSQIASGNLNICLNIRSRDEIGELANSFNQMVERLAAAAEDRDRLQRELLEKQKLEQELKLAAEIQKSFLPEGFPTSPRFRARARSVPSQVIGGDFYDFLELPEERVGIAIGDVAGRGIAAAVYLARLISDFRAAAQRSGSPRDVLERLNQQLLARSTRGLFVTMTYLILDANSGEVSYSSAGHLPILRRRCGVPAVELVSEAEGLPLGVSSRPGLGEQSWALESLETLLLATDGVVEGLSGDRAVFDLDRLVGIFQNEDGSGEFVVDAIFKEIARTSVSTPPEDDMTVLALSWTASRSLGMQS